MRRSIFEFSKGSECFKSWTVKGQYHTVILCNTVCIFTTGPTWYKQTIKVTVTHPFVLNSDTLYCCTVFANRIQIRKFIKISLQDMWKHVQHDRSQFPAKCIDTKLTASHLTPIKSRLHHIPPQASPEPLHFLLPGRHCQKLTSTPPPGNWGPTHSYDPAWRELAVVLWADTRKCVATGDKPTHEENRQKMPSFSMWQHATKSSTHTRSQTLCLVSTHLSHTHAHSRVPQ
jgi:hypothetical protein